MSTAFYISFGVLWVLVAFNTAVSIGLTRTLHRALGEGSLETATDEQGLHGQPAPEFSRVSLAGTTIDNEYLAGQLSALLFVSPDCSTCGVTLDELEALAGKTRGSLVVVCRSTTDKCVQLTETYRLPVPVIVDSELELSRLFRVAGPPTAVLIDADGRVQRYGQPMRPGDLETTLEEAYGGLADYAPPRSGLDREPWRRVVVEEGD